MGIDTQTQNLIVKNMGTLVNLGKIPVGKIIPEERYASRIGLTSENCMKNEAFVELFESIESHGQQEPLHVVKKSETEFICVAGYRRTLALQQIRFKHQSEISAIAYVWEKDTSEEILMQIATFTNAKRKNLSIIEKLHQYRNYVDLYPETSKAKIAKELSLGRNEVYIMEDFDKFQNQLQKFLGDETNRDNYPEQYNQIPDIIKYIESDLLKLSVYDKLIRLTQDDTLIIREIGVDEFFIKLELFKSMMNDKYSFLSKKESKSKYLNRLKNVGIEGLSKKVQENSNEDKIDIEDEFDKIDKSIPSMDDIIKENKKKEEELAKELATPEEKLLNEVIEKQIEEDNTVSDDYRAKVAIEAIYSALVQIKHYDLVEFFTDHADEFDLHRKFTEDKKFNYDGSVEFFEKLVGLLDIIKGKRGFIFDKSLKHVIKEEKKNEKELEKEKIEYSKQKEKINNDYEKAIDLVNKKTDNEISDLKTKIKSADKKEKEALKALITKVRMDSKQEIENIQKEKNMVLSGLEVS